MSTDRGGDPLRAGADDVRRKDGATGPGGGGGGVRVPAAWWSTDAGSSAGSVEAGDSEAAAPDGGWGWAVVGASFVAHMIADGLCFSFGVLFAELLAVFGTPLHAYSSLLLPASCRIVGGISM